MQEEQQEKKKYFSFRHPVVQILLAIILIGIGAGIEYLLTKNKSATPGYIEPIFTRQADPLYPLIKPLVRIDFPTQFTFSELSNLRNEADKFIKQQQAAGKIKRASFYFRDTNNAHWVGIGQDDKYHPASLFKVPYLMALYKETEVNPQLLNDRIYFSGANHNNADQVQHLASGHYYTMAELAKAMIKESDNDAKDLLLGKIDQQFLIEALNDNGMSLQDATDNTMSPRIYTTFFRTFYNASFLSSAMSEQALELLSEVDFKDGLVAGIPSTIKIAHKFGEYANLDNDNVTSLELHDCGLVYFPDHPYYLCVMTEGYSREDLASVIKGIANISFNEFSKVYPVKK